MVGVVCLGGVGACDEPPSEPAQTLVQDGEDAPARTQEPESGGVCLTSKQCPKGEYCATEDGECGREGVCTPTPEACDRTRDPVCSCNGKDFRNPCEAAKLHENIDHAGPCPPPTCTANSDCLANEYCAKATGDCDGGGVCEVKPALCSGLWNPVCGCNDGSYANACKAALAGISVQALGLCP